MQEIGKSTLYALIINNKKYTFYLLTIKIFKMHFDALKEGLVKIEDSWNVTRKVRYNLTKIISDIERELKVYE